MRLSLLAVLLVLGCAPDDPNDMDQCQTREQDMFQTTLAETEGRLGCGTPGPTCSGPDCIDASCHRTDGGSASLWAMCYDRVTMASSCAALRTAVWYCEH